MTDTSTPASTAPLSARVAAPAELAVPETSTVAWRPLVADDADAVTELSRAMDAVDHPNWLTTREEIDEEFAHSYVDLGRDGIVAEDAAGTVVAYGLVVMPPGQETLVRSILFGGVHPDRRGEGLGRRLLGWQQGRALQQLASSPKPLPGWMMLYADERTPAAARLATSEGFRAARYFSELHRDLAEPIPPVALPRDIRLVEFTAELSTAVHEAKNAAFRDHWGSQPSTQEQWESMLGLSTSRPDLSFVALAGDEVVGLIMSTVNDEDWPGQGFSSGYISLVGVVRERRRQGIAPALLARALEAYRDAGFERAVLDVDTENPTGALSLYTGMGFTAANREIAFVREF